jgi:hypothetical protein
MIYIIVNESYDGAIRSTDILYVTTNKQIAEKEFNSLKELKPDIESDFYILYEFNDMAITGEHSYPGIDTSKYIKEVYDNSYKYEDD